MSTDPIKYTKPIYYNPPMVYPNCETTEQVQYVRNPYLSNPYEDMPPPPPPQRRIPKGLLLVFISIVCLTTILIGMLFTVIYSSTQQSSIQATPTQVSVFRPTAILTPTLDAHTALQSYDFSKFIEAFATDMTRKNYLAIQSVTDTENFQTVYLCADGGFETWKNVYGQLTTGNLSFIIRYPPITAEEEGYSGYAGKNVPVIGTINAMDVQDVVGTAFEPDAPSGYLPTTPDKTVFVFENPYETGGPVGWLWRAVIYNNGCL